MQAEANSTARRPKLFCATTNVLILICLMYGITYIDRVNVSTVSAAFKLVVIGFLCSLAFMVPIVFTHNLALAAICLSLTFFFAEFTIGPMWAIPLDIAPKFSGSASGLMNTGSALAAILSLIVFGYVIDKNGNWELPFIGSIGLVFFGSILAFSMEPDEGLGDAA